ncbi:PQQ-binding-like beta-propeller repeat protein [Nonomuraea wenchangensis]|uniref:outer membrane protein assembly factor BamB family protein n=1 Tax=Nonomuraea wenchangensis TaxID=568860 RepID=UPI003327D86D
MARLLAVLLLGLLPVSAGEAAVARPSSRLVPLWHADVPTPRGGYQHALTAHHLLVHTSQGVVALGTADGRVSWRHRIAGRSTAGWDVSAGVVLIDYSASPTQGGHVLVAVSGAMGEQLWRRDGLSLPPGWVRTVDPRRHPAVFLAWDAGRSSLQGVSGTTGRDLWSYRPPAPCTVSGTTGRAADLLVVLKCGRSVRALLLEAATGRTRGSLPLPVGETLTVQVADGVIAVSGHEGITLYDDLGRAVLHHERCWPRCAVIRYGDLLLTTHHSGEDDVLTATSWPAGKPVWEVRPAPAYVRLLDGGVAARATQGGLPVIDLIDHRTGRPTSYGLPFPASVLAAAGQRVYVGSTLRGAGETDGVRVWALRRVTWSGGSPLLGGEDAARWPDACSLRPDPSYVPGSAGRTLSGFVMPEPVTCRYTRNDGAHVDLRVMWVARAPDEAADLIDLLGEANAYRPLAGVGDQAVADTTPPSTIVFRAGPVVASVSSGYLALRDELPDIARSVSARIARAPDTGRAGSVPVAGSPEPVSLVNLPGTQATLADHGPSSSRVEAYLLDGRTYVRRGETYRRLGPVMGALSPDGAWAARTEDSYPARGRRDPVLILDTGTGAVHRIATVKAPQGVSSPVWSPDGNHLLLTATDDNVITGFVLIDLRTLKPRYVRVRDGEEYSGAFRWGGDSASVAVQTGPAEMDAEDHGDVAYLDLQGQVLRRFTKVGRLLDRQYSTSPSGRSFATRCPGSSDSTCVWRTTDGAAVARVPFDPQSFVSWYAEDRFLGWSALSAGERTLVVTDLAGRPGSTLLRSRGQSKPDLSLALSARPEG